MKIIREILEPLDNNCYILVNNGYALVVDPSSEVMKKIVAVAAVVMMMDMVVADVLAVVEVIHHLLMVLMSERHAGCIIREPSTMEHSLTHLMTGENHWSSYVVLV